ncbi:MAG: ImmA/IrrE family metallo-endopeptidase [Acidobacteriota bacterium]
MSSESEQSSPPADQLLPPTAKRRVYERIALKIREFAGVPLDQALDPWQLTEHVKLKVVDINQVEGLSEEARKALLADNSKTWSGATTMPLPNGWRLVFLNPNHSRERQTATLMEEVCHIILGHSPSQLILPVEGQSQARFRNFNKAQEEAAYAIGAAALIPYYILRLAVERGIPGERIAQKFRVSKELVIYRIKVCRLWDVYKQRQPRVAK